MNGSFVIPENTMCFHILEMTSFEVVFFFFSVSVVLALNPHHRTFSFSAWELPHTL